ncbi:Gar1/Naf1 RNA binding region family protein [Theileria parva strain Muguga]|uniref:Gar1/Naf1 RNA binding region family protein n=1 Tax=Theileria parva strain Muguga TaxID=333668 RepID=UPI001C62194B|nr:Gar1/Naf1 RNA binding region family protein [Theileria parva strain Muguga]EAN31702.2 Gar1/Naf1 RNA binding region family protein [Theileria parva strain Muguga]
MKSKGGFLNKGTFKSGKPNKRDNSGHNYSNEAPSEVIEVGTVSHVCENQVVIKCTLVDKVPYFNGRIFLSNKQEVGKIDEILGQVNNFYCSVKLNEGFKAKSFETNSKLYIDPKQSLPMARFTSRPEVKQFAVKKSVKKDKSFKTGRPTAAHNSRGTFKLSRGNSRISRGTIRR